MKVLVISTLFTVLSGASAGSAVAWPGARDVSAQHVLAGPAVVNTLVPQTKVFGFSTTQYINSVPSAAPIAFQPQVHYQVPQLSHFAPVQHTTFYPIAGGSYYPSNVYYPPFAIAPSAPGYPVSQIIPGSQQPPQNIPGYPQGTPSFPPQGLPSQDQQQTAGDADTAVVDSADFPQQQDQDQKQDQPQDKPQEQGTTTEAPQQDEPAPPHFPPAGNFPSLPQTPSFPSLPQFPQFPQGGQAPAFPAFPSFPQIPQGDEQPSFPSFPQFPQGSLPQFPQLPQFPSNPSYPQSPTPTPPSSFPGAGSSEGEKGLNDEDTISVESA